MSPLDKESLNKKAESVWKIFWTPFTNFSTASAGFIGIIIILRGIKLIADTIIHGYALHSVFRWLMHLLGALWASVTNLFLHLGKPQIITEQTEESALERYRTQLIR